MMVSPLLSGASVGIHAIRRDVLGADYSLENSWCSASLRMKLSERIEDEVGNVPSVFAKLVESHRLFKSSESYQHLLAAQLVMLASVRPLYDDPLIQRQFPQLTRADNLVQIILDLARLGLSPADKLAAVDCLPHGFINRLGWFYISESLTHLVPSCWELARELELTENVAGDHAQPRTENSYRWLLLKETLDNLSLSEVEEDRIFAGARSAISLFAKLVRDASDLRHQHPVGRGQ
jgi:heme oxygenase